MITVVSECLADVNVRLMTNVRLNTSMMHSRPVNDEVTVILAPGNIDASENVTLLKD